MNTLEQQSTFESGNDRAKAEARARAVLNRSPLSPGLTLVTWLVIAALAVFVYQVVPADQRTTTILGILSVFVASNAVDSWVSRRRLDAAITLLKLRDDER